MDNNKKEYMRITKSFYRILLNSPNDSQTVALVPDEHFARDITRLLSTHVKIRENQNFTCRKDKLRPEESEKVYEISWVVDAPDQKEV